jgi:hypothetical protein
MCFEKCNAEKAIYLCDITYFYIDILLILPVISCRSQLGWPGRDNGSSGNRFFFALVEESSKADESVGQFINEAKRNPNMMFGHARMNLNEMCALDVTVHSGLEGLATVPAIQFKLS